MVHVALLTWSMLDWSCFCNPRGQTLTLWTFVVSFYWMMDAAKIILEVTCPYTKHNVHSDPESTMGWIINSPKNDNSFWRIIFRTLTRHYVNTPVECGVFCIRLQCQVYKLKTTWYYIGQGHDSVSCIKNSSGVLCMNSMTCSHWGPNQPRLAISLKLEGSVVW